MKIRLTHGTHTHTHDRGSYNKLLTPIYKCGLQISSVKGSVIPAGRFNGNLHILNRLRTHTHAHARLQRDTSFSSRTSVLYLLFPLLVSVCVSGY